MALQKKRQGTVDQLVILFLKVNECFPFKVQTIWLPFCLKGNSMCLRHFSFHQNIDRQKCMEMIRDNEFNY